MIELWLSSIVLKLNNTMIGCASSSRENVLVAISNCGYDQVYECRVTGSGATVWGGSAFNCPSTNNEIISFFHSKFKNCSCGGAIVGRTIRAENNTYISQLIVSVNAETIGMSISCLHDSGLGGAAKLIGFSMLTLTTGNVKSIEDGCAVYSL